MRTLLSYFTAEALVLLILFQAKFELLFLILFQYKVMEKVVGGKGRKFMFLFVSHNLVPDSLSDYECITEI